MSSHYLDFSSCRIVPGFCKSGHIYIYIYIYISRLTVVSREAKEEVPCEGLSTNAREYFTRTNLVKIKKCHNWRAFNACAL